MPPDSKANRRLQALGGSQRQTESDHTRSIVDLDQDIIAKNPVWTTSPVQNAKAEPIPEPVSANHDFGQDYFAEECEDDYVAAISSSTTKTPQTEPDKPNSKTPAARPHTYRTKEQKAEQKRQKREKKERDRLVTMHNWEQQLKRLQRYLGLRPRVLAMSYMPEELISANWSTQEAWRKAEEQKSGRVLSLFDPSRPAPNVFENEVIFVSIDVESFERNHSLVTEIGISTLDTRDISQSPPGEDAALWISKIRSRHVRIKGREYLVNRDFVRGDPDAFKFGESEFIEISDAGALVDAAFDVSDPQSLHTDVQANRVIVMVGHDVDNDINYLKLVGSKIFKEEMSNTNLALPNWGEDSSTETIEQEKRKRIIEALDTGVLYRILFTKAEDSDSRQTPGLGKVLAKLDIVPWSLHNAGNDARYTLEAALHMAVRARLEKNKNILALEWEAAEVSNDR